MLEADLKDKGENVARFLAAISAEPILSYNISFLQNHVHYVASGDDDIMYAVILDKERRRTDQREKGTRESARTLEYTSPILQQNENDRPGQDRLLDPRYQPGAWQIAGDPGVPLLRDHAGRFL